MRTVLIILCLWMVTLSADQLCDKIKDCIAEQLSTSGTLKQDSQGYVYVDIDDRYIVSLIELIEKEGFEQPPYFGPGLHGAHISVISAQEAKKFALGKIKERGATIPFTIKDCQIVHPPTWKEVESIYILTVEAPLLDELRQQYGLPKSRYDFHITIGLIYKEAQAA